MTKHFQFPTAVVAVYLLAGLWIGRSDASELNSLSDAEIRARLAFLDEQERELLKNFETVGRQIEQDGDGDVLDKAD
ncbi:MAG: hypothetical protein ABGZ17_21630, partial [Planctomycetaceae bacterium]